MSPQPTARTQTVICAGCRDNILTATASPCPVCNILQHTECLQELGCSSLNCNIGGVLEHNPRATNDEHDCAGNPLVEFAREAIRQHDIAVLDEDDMRIHDVSRLAEAYSIIIPQTYVSADDSHSEANRIWIDTNHGATPCHCYELGLDCNGHPYSQNETACRWLVANSEGYAVNIIEEPCTCGVNNGASDDPSEQWACELHIMSVINGLVDNSVIDEQLVCQLDTRKIDESFEEWGLEEFLNLCGEHYVELVDELRDEYGHGFIDSELASAYYKAASVTGNYPWYEHNSGTVFEHAERNKANNRDQIKDKFLAVFNAETGFDDIEPCEDCTGYGSVDMYDVTYCKGCAEHYLQQDADND